MERSMFAECEQQVNQSMPVANSVRKLLHRARGTGQALCDSALFVLQLLERSALQSNDAAHCISALHTVLPHLRGNSAANTFDRVANAFIRAVFAADGNSQVQRNDPARRACACATLRLLSPLLDEVSLAASHHSSSRAQNAFRKRETSADRLG